MRTFTTHDSIELNGGAMELETRFVPAEVGPGLLRLRLENQKTLEAVEGAIRLNPLTSWVYRLFEFGQYLVIVGERLVVVRSCDLACVSSLELLYEELETIDGPACGGLDESGALRLATEQRVIRVTEAGAIVLTRSPTSSSASSLSPTLSRGEREAFFARPEVLLAPAMAEELLKEINRRRTFAIISHPDAGKTTLTEKLLLYGGAIHLAGSVKARRAKRYATSDWMAIEKERGISVTSSVLQFNYRDHAVNLLDTPGHQDFSEDTYRTLSAADSAVMLIDAAKGVEPQTIKLFKVCKMRGIPIFTFANKLDRYGHTPLELMDELEKVLGMRAFPMNWPIGSGPEFRGVYDRRTKNVHVFQAEGRHGEAEVEERIVPLDSDEIKTILTESELEKLNEDIELLDIGGDEFSVDKVLAGELSPMFFGSAMTNFGVRPFLDAFIELAPVPSGRPSSTGFVEPTGEKFAGFVFKIQANMDPAHRDRIAFLRVVSGHYEKGMTAHHERLDKDIRLAKPTQFMASERTSIEDAWPGDVIGLFDPGIFRIGDTLIEGNKRFDFECVPRFSPEFFAIVRSKDPMKRKQMEKGLEQLAEEGTIQIFQQLQMGMKDPIVGVVGQLQFEVLQFRMEAEYGANILIDRLPFSHARWVVAEKFDPKSFDWEGNRQTVQDRDGMMLVLFRDEWAMHHALEKHPELKFQAHAPQLHANSVIVGPQ